MHLRSCLILNQSFKRKLNMTIGAWSFISKQSFNKIKRLPLLYTPYHISTDVTSTSWKSMKCFDPHGEIGMSKLFIQAHIHRWGFWPSFFYFMNGKRNEQLSPFYPCNVLQWNFIQCLKQTKLQNLAEGCYSAVTMSILYRGYFHSLQMKIWSNSPILHPN